MHGPRSRHGRVGVRRSSCVWVVASVLLGGLAAGCAGTDEKDVRYRESQLLPPLEIPEGLTRPEHTGYLAIPERRGAGQPAGPPVDSRPPNMLGDS